MRSFWLYATTLAFGASTVCLAMCGSCTSPPATGGDAADDRPALDSPMDDADDALSEADAATCSAAFPTLDFRPIEHGTFVMGSPPDEPQRGLYSETQVQVTLTHDFEITATELTQAQWDRSCFPNPSGKNDASGVKDGIGSNFPVGNVTYWEALAFANNCRRWPVCHRVMS